MSHIDRLRQIEQQTAFRASTSSNMSAQKPVTLFFLQASRSIRTAWLLEELGVPYNVEFADRQNQKAPQEFKDRSGNPLGKFPSINDNGVNVYESGAITE